MTIFKGGFEWFFLNKINNFSKELAYSWLSWFKVKKKKSEWSIHLNSSYRGVLVCYIYKETCESNKRSEVCMISWFCKSYLQPLAQIHPLSVGRHLFQLCFLITHTRGTGMYNTNSSERLPHAEEDSEMVEGDEMTSFPLMSEDEQDFKSSALSTVFRSSKSRSCLCKACGYQKLRNASEIMYQQLEVYCGNFKKIGLVATSIWTWISFLWASTWVPFTLDSLPAPAAWNIAPT